MKYQDLVFQFKLSIKKPPYHTRLGTSGSVDPSHNGAGDRKGVTDCMIPGTPVTGSDLANNAEQREQFFYK